MNQNQIILALPQFGQTSQLSIHRHVQHKGKKEKKIEDSDSVEFRGGLFFLPREYIPNSKVVLRA